MLWVRSALALATLLVFPGLLESFEAPKIAAVRVCGFAAIGWLFAGAFRRVRPAAADFAVAGWLAIELLATAFSIEPRLSLMGEPLQREGMLTSIALAGIYFAARASHAGPRDVERTRDTFLAALALACGYALVQAARLDPVPWARTAEFGGVVRPFGTLGHPNLLGAVAAAATPLALAAFAHDPRRRWVHGPAAILFTAAVVLGFSRGAWIAWALGTGTTLAFAGRAVLAAVRGDAPVTAAHSGPPVAMAARAGRARIVAALGAAIALVSAFALTGWGRILAERFRSLVAPVSGASAARLEIWRAALAAWRARPALGQGPDTFQLVYPRYQTPEYWNIEWSGLPVQAHSVYLHTLATRGIAGVAALAVLALSFVPLAARALRDPKRRALAAGTLGTLVALAAAGGFGAIGITGAVLALVALAWMASLAGHQSAAPLPARLPRRAIVASAALGLLVLAAEAHELTASRRIARAVAVARVAPAEADAASLAAWRARPFDTAIAMGRVETLVARSAIDPAALREAESVARAAVAIEPARADCERHLARVLALRAVRREVSPDSMASHYEAAFALAPVDALIRIECAYYALRIGRPALAAAAALDATALYPGEAAAWALVARARAATGDLPGTREALARARAGEWRGDEEGRARVENAWAIAVAADSAAARAAR